MSELLTELHPMLLRGFLSAQAIGVYASFYPRGLLELDYHYQASQSKAESLPILLTISKVRTLVSLYSVANRNPFFSAHAFKIGSICV